MNTYISVHRYVHTSTYTQKWTIEPCWYVKDSRPTCLVVRASTQTYLPTYILYIYTELNQILDAQQSSYWYCEWRLRLQSFSDGDCDCCMRLLISPIRKLNIVVKDQQDAWCFAFFGWAPCSLPEYSETRPFISIRMYSCHLVYTYVRTDSLSLSNHAKNIHTQTLDSS